MSHDQYYIYYIRQGGDGMFLTEFRPRLSGNFYGWTPHHELFAWKMPLFFPTLEQAETTLEDLMAAPPAGLLMAAAVRPGIGRWLTMSGAKRNQHPDPYEWATWKPGDTSPKGDSV